jgi:hypothetical protein
LPKYLANEFIIICETAAPCSAYVLYSRHETCFMCIPLTVRCNGTYAQKSVVWVYGAFVKFTNTKLYYNLFALYIIVLSRTKYEYKGMFKIFIFYKKRQNTSNGSIWTYYYVKRRTSKLSSVFVSKHQAYKLQISTKGFDQSFVTKRDNRLRCLSLECQDKSICLFYCAFYEYCVSYLRLARKDMFPSLFIRSMVRITLLMYKTARKMITISVSDQLNWVEISFRISNFNNVC